MAQPGCIFTKPTACRASCIFNSASAPSCLAAHTVAVLHSLQAYATVHMDCGLRKRDISQTVKSA